MTPDVATSFRFAPGVRKALHRKLLKRGAVVATLLGDVLAGKDRNRELAVLGLDRPGATPEDQLRDTLQQIEWRRRLLDGGDDRYGRCDVCGVELDLVTLEEMPWADHCHRHAPRWL